MKCHAETLQLPGGRFQSPGGKPLEAATLPTVVMMSAQAGAGGGLWGWWRAAGIEYVAFGFNIVLCSPGSDGCSGRSRTWRSALVTGCVDELLGVIVVGPTR